MIGARGECRHCQRQARLVPRQLCWTCYYGRSGVRQSYPSVSIYAGGAAALEQGLWHGIPDRCFGEPAEPTPHAPGSPAKKATLQARASRGLALWHPGDCREWHEGCLQPCGEGPNEAGKNSPPDGSE